ncbi:MAG: hypothetical protein OXP73_01980 [Chloroflexota bacterium]|nr:hypothetical protein [Chloroflexota bacterium]
MNGNELWAKLRPTAVIFASIMAILTWLLIKYVLSGQLGTAAFGDGQAAAIVASALIIVGVAIGSLGNAVLKLSEDSAPSQVPEGSHQRLMDLVLWLGEQRNADAGQDQMVENVQGHRGGESLGDGG